MNRKEVKSFLPILQAFADEKEIECREEDKWYKVLEICNEMNPQDYRIKPEPKYRPFKDAEECWQEMLKHQPFGWLKGDKCFYNIVSVSNIDVSMANVSGDIVTLDFSEVMEDNTFADGVPFGVKIDDDYNGIK